MCTIKQDRYSPRFIYTFKRLLVKVSLQPMQSSACVDYCAFTQIIFGVLYLSDSLFFKVLYPSILSRFNKKYVKILLHNFHLIALVSAVVALHLITL